MDRLKDILMQEGVWNEFRKEFYWRVLLCKTEIVFHPDWHYIYNDIYPEADVFMDDNPFLHKKIVFLMKLLSSGHSGIVKVLLRISNKTKSIEH